MSREQSGYIAELRRLRVYWTDRQANLDLCHEGGYRKLQEPR